MSDLATQKLEQVVQIGNLLDYYGQLLTDRQREFIRLHYAEDMSYGEIGRLSNVSRQAVHDAVRHGVNSMKNYETKLGLVAAAAAVENAEQAAPEQLPKVRQRLEELREWVRKQGVIYNTSSLQAKLKNVIDLLAEDQAPNESAPSENANVDHPAANQLSENQAERD